MVAGSECDGCSRRVADIVFGYLVCVLSLKVIPIHDKYRAWFKFNSDSITLFSKFTYQHESLLTKG